MNFKIITDCADPHPHTWGGKSVPETYDADYFLRGKETGKSNYENYSWKPEQTLQHAIYVQRHLGIHAGDSVLDVGCARGYFVKALRMMGIQAFGHDISRWAIENCDPDVVEFVSNELVAEKNSFDWITCKDCMEHIPMEKLEPLLKQLSAAAKKGMFIIVPLAKYFGGQYVRDEDEADKTHIHRFTISDWLEFLMKHTKNMTVSGSFYLKGVKECCRERSMSCGFFTLTRI